MPAIAAPLVEREGELEALELVVDAARRGDGGAAIVEGPAGIGKTRLLSAVAVTAELDVVRARASELERDYPFGVVRQLFEPVLFAAGEDERERLLAGAGALAERVLAASPAEAGAVDVYATLHGLYWFAANLSATHPVLLLVDDAHWADAASLRWFGFLLRRLEGVALALVLAVRTGEGERGQLDELVSDPAVRVINPAALSEGGVGQLLELALGERPDPEFVTACGRATGGNPFLLRELTDELVRRAIRASAANAPLVARLSASGVGRAVRTRLGRLPPSCLELARAVSVLGDGCELPLAARLAELEEPDAAQAVDALAAASVLEPSRPLAFVHPLVRASVYEELGPGGRSTWHRQAVTALTEARAGADRLAVHLLVCDPQGDRDTVQTLREAAEAARRRDADDVAATYLRRALREPATPELEPQLLSELGAAELRAGQIDAAIENLERALERARDPSMRAMVALELASALTFTDRLPAAVDLLTNAIDDLPSDDVGSLGRLVAMRAVAGWASVEARRRLPSLAELPQTAETPRTVGERLLVAHRALEESLAGTADQARALALRALGHDELLRATGSHFPPLYLAVNALVWAHAFEDAERHLQAALSDARRHGSEVGFMTASTFRSALCWQRGMLAEAEADARGALERGIRPYAVSAASAYLAEALVARGDPEAAAAELHVGGLDAGTPAPVLGVLAPAALAHVRLAQHRPDDALALLFECGRHEDAWGVVVPAFTNWRAEAAILLARAGDLDRALELADEAVRRADAFGSPVPRAIALRAAALVRQPSDTDVLASAVAMLRGSGAQLELASSLVELGSALRRAGHRADARDPLREGLEIAVACGAGVLAARAHDELVAAGARPRRDPVESRSALTASELRVARIAAEGLTNREIAQSLFLTEKTIEVHLTRVYRKLDIHSRSQLARALAAA